MGTLPPNDWAHLVPSGWSAMAKGNRLTMAGGNPTRQRRYLRLFGRWVRVPRWVWVGPVTLSWVAWQRLLGRL